MQNIRNIASIPLYLRSILLTVTILFLQTYTVDAQSLNATTPTDSTYLVSIDPNLTEAERTTLFQSFNAQLVRWLPEIHLAEIRVNLNEGQANNGSANVGSVNADSSNNRSLGASASGENAATQMASPSAIGLASHPSIEFFEENSVVYGTTAPNDPALQDTTNGYAQQLLQMEEAWHHTLGSANVTIAILDTGIDTEHPELAGQIVPGYDFVNRRTTAEDDNGHGTHVAGIIGAQINNFQGSAGVCPNCRLMPVKVLDQHNVGVWSIIIQGIIFAADNGAQVINLSLGSTEETNAVRKAIQYAQDKGVLIVAAAGNSRSAELFYPAAYPGVLSVAATDNEDREWSLSNYGTHIDVSAPGYLIYSTSIRDEAYSYMTGTSMAAPFVAGLAGLLLSKDATISAEGLSNLIIENSIDLGKPGWDPTFGFGRIDAHAALQSLEDTSQIQVPLRGPNKDLRIFVPLVIQ